MCAGITQRLERLADAFESQGLDVRSNLLPGASAADLDALEADLMVRLPEGFRQLYRWSAGSRDPESDPALRFRDNTFMPLTRVSACRRELMETYGDGRGPSPDGYDLATAAPFAEFMGSVYLVVCGDPSPLPSSPHPVIGAFHGLEVYFHSLESMLDTCIEWVEQPGFSPDAGPPDELAIWQRHNPGLFT